MNRSLIHVSASFIAASRNSVVAGAGGHASSDCGAEPAVPCFELGGDGQRDLLVAVALRDEDRHLGIALTGRDLPQHVDH